MENDIDGAIFDIVRSKVVLDKDEVLTQSTPISDLGIESIDVIEIIFEIEDLLGVSVDTSDFPIDAQTTIGNLVEFAKGQGQRGVVK